MTCFYAMQRMVTLWAVKFANVASLQILAALVYRFELCGIWCSWNYGQKCNTILCNNSCQLHHEYSEFSSSESERRAVGSWNCVQKWKTKWYNRSDLVTSTSTSDVFAVYRSRSRFKLSYKYYTHIQFVLHSKHIKTPLKYHAVNDVQENKCRLL
jgi:hypothetical protein